MLIVYTFDTKRLKKMLTLAEGYYIINLASRLEHKIKPVNAK